MKNKSLKIVANHLLTDLRALIESARSQMARTFDSGLVVLNWHIGQRLRRDVIGGPRAKYGDQIVDTIAKNLTLEYGSGFTRSNLFHMLRYVEVFPDPKIVSTLCRQLGWSHFRAIIYLDDPLRRNFYAEMCRIERWSVRLLSDKIDGMLFERTALAKKPEKLVKKELAALREEDRLTPDLVFHDPYFLDFLGLKSPYSEKDLESAILRELENFLVEMGSDFSFLARQKRITVDNEDYYIDLLFYHRKMRRLVGIELKLGKLKAADKGQMELYLRWLEKYERRPGEEAPIGLILCAGKTAEHVELLELEKSGIRVAHYLTELPPRKILEKKLHDAIYLARERLARNMASERKLIGHNPPQENKE